MEFIIKFITTVSVRTAGQVKWSVNLVPHARLEREDWFRLGIELKRNSRKENVRWWKFREMKFPGANIPEGNFPGANTPEGNFPAMKFPTDKFPVANMTLGGDILRQDFLRRNLPVPIFPRQNSLAVIDAYGDELNRILVAYSTNLTSFSNSKKCNFVWKLYLTKNAREIILTLERRVRSKWPHTYF